MRREHHAVADSLYPYFQDVYDHVLRATESTDALRDLVSTIVETNLSLRDYHQNQIMKRVTSWAAIIAVPTLITGYYGMNVPYPGYGETSGVIISALLIRRRRAASAFWLLLIPLGLAPYFVMPTMEMMVEYRFYLPLAGVCSLAGPSSYLVFH